jgi:hypothetical protein
MFVEITAALFIGIVALIRMVGAACLVRTSLSDNTQLFLLSWPIVIFIALVIEAHVSNPLSWCFLLGGLFGWPFAWPLLRRRIKPLGETLIRLTRTQSRA